ncbi:MAG: MMPL family transporter [Magnetococcales bacterium]|nr:MMPL family transporter [Magnetococcales bacterium]
METLIKILLIGTRHRLASLIFLTVVSAWCAYGLIHIRIETNLASLAGDHAPDRALYDQVVQEFGSDNKIVLYIRDSNLWQADKLAVLTTIHRTLEKLSFVTKVDSIINTTTIRFADGALITGPLLTEGTTDPFLINQARNNALDNPLLAGQLVSDDGLALSMVISYEEQKWNKQFDFNAYRAIEGIVEENRTQFQQIFQVGSPRLSEELKKNIVDDLLVLAPLSAAVLALSIIFLMGSSLAAILPVITSVISLLWTFGTMGWFGIPINVLTAMLPSLVLVIGATEDTHMLSAYLGQMNRLLLKLQLKTATTDNNSFSSQPPAAAGYRLEAVQNMLRHIGLPLLLTLTTTALGFFSNMLSDIEMIRDFALSATLAIFFNGIVSLLLTPMILSFFGPTRSKLTGARGEVLGISGWIIRLFDRIIHHHGKTTLLITAILVLFFLHHARSLHVTNDPLSYFHSDQPLVIHSEQIHEDFSGVKSFFVYLESQEAGAFKNPANIERLQKIQTWLNQKNLHDSSLSLADLLSLINRSFHKGQQNYFQIPDSQNLVEQYLLFLSRKQLSPLVNHDFSAATILVRHNISDSHELNLLVEDLKQSARLIAGTEIATSVLGENLMINAAADDLIAAQIKSLGLLLAVIFVLMSLLFTSLKGGFISLVPNLLPIVLVFGTMGLLGLSINPGTAMVAVIAIGIAVDDTIHLLSRYMEECRTTSNRDQAVRRTIREQAVPVISTSIALMMGFLVLSYSNFTIIAQFGQLSAATLFFALVADLLITPIFMRHIRLVGFAQILALKVRREVVDKSPLFTGMSLFEVKKTILISELKRFNTNDLLMRQGAVGKSLGLILSGRVQVSFMKPGQTEPIVLATLTPGQIFGEIGFIQATKRVASIRAMEPVEVLVFDFDQLQKEMKFFPHISAKLNLNISRILGNRLAESMAKDMTA